MTPERECYPDCPKWEGDHRPGCPNELEALRNENSRLRQLLDEIHRGEATPPRAPRRYLVAAAKDQDARGVKCRPFRLEHLREMLGNFETPAHFVLPDGRNQ